MHPLYKRAHELTAEVLASAKCVQEFYGIGLLESIYVKSLARELELAGYASSSEQCIRVDYKGKIIEERLRYDLLVEGCVLVEAKAIEGEITVEHRMQLLSYMKVLDIPVGLIINFGNIRLPARGVKRVILKGADAADELS